VTVHGATLRKAAPQPTAAEAGGDWETELPEPERPALGHEPYNIIVTGVGGTGIVTVGAILGMAAHLEGKGCGMIDMAGLAQKGGAVYSHVRLAATPEDIHAIRVFAGEADLVLGCDLVVTGSKKVLAAVNKGETALIVNTAEIHPGDFTRNADYVLPVERIKRAISTATGDRGVYFVDATTIATAVLGNAIATNMFMLGYAYQQGKVPVSAAALERAITMNGEAVAMNIAAFRWGRRTAVEPEAVARLVAPVKEPTPARRLSQSLDETVARRVDFLTAYQNAAYAERYRALVERVRAREAAVTGSTALAEAVARNLFKLMAYKDEYEVGRLYTDGNFARQLAATFAGDKMRLEFHLAPPILSPKDAHGHPRKMTFGPWILPAFRLLASLKFLRGTAFDIFGRSEERKLERKLIADYEALLDEILAKLDAGNHALAVALAAIPEKIRGFGHVKQRHLDKAKREEAELLARFRNKEPPLAVAAE